MTIPTTTIRHQPTLSVRIYSVISVPDSVNSSLLAPHNMKNLINGYHKKSQGCPASTATCTADFNCPLSGQADSDGVTTSVGKHIVAFSSESCLSILDHVHEVTYISTLMELLKLCRSISSRSGLCEVMS